MPWMSSGEVSTRTRERRAALLFHALPEAGDELLPVAGIQVGIERVAVAVLVLVEDPPRQSRGASLGRLGWEKCRDGPRAATTALSKARKLR